MRLTESVQWVLLGIFFIFITDLHQVIFDTFGTNNLQNILNVMLNFSEGIIALCALGFTIYQAYKLAEEKRLSNLPEITRFDGYHNSNPSIEITNCQTSKTEKPRLYNREIILKNSGLGPARIIQMKVFYKNELISDSSFDDFSQNIKKLIEINNFQIKSYRYTIWQKNQIIAPQESIQFLFIEINYLDTKDIQKLKNFFQDIQVRIDYISLMNKTILNYP